MAKDKEPKKKKKKADAGEGISLAGHPRARPAIRRARARTALAAFVIVLVVALHGGVDAQDAVARALIAGVAGNLAAWAVGVALWRQIVLAELRAVHRRRRERAEALRAPSAETAR